MSSQAVGRLYHRAGPRRLIRFGMLALAAVSVPLVCVGLDTSLRPIWAIMLGFFLRATRVRSLRADQMTPPEAAGISGWTLVVLRDAGHVCNIEAPEAFDRAVRNFLHDTRS